MQVQLKAGANQQKPRCTLAIAVSTHLVSLLLRRLPLVSQVIQGVGKGAMSVTRMVQVICCKGQGPHHLQHFSDNHIKRNNVGPYAARQHGVQLPQRAPLHKLLRSPAVRQHAEP